jgi:glycerol-1-phosphate dehydrogenase [NAD(P)+]
MGRLQQGILTATPAVKPLPHNEVQFHRLFGKEAGAIFAPAYARKLLRAEQAATLNARLAKDWQHIKKELAAIMLPSVKLERMFIQTLVPTQIRELKITQAHYQTACTHAYLTRDRFTFLDLAAMMGVRIG